MGCRIGIDIPHDGMKETAEFDLLKVQNRVNLA